VREYSTLADVRPVERGPRPRWPHRILVGLLLVVVVAGAAGLLGVRSTTASASAGRDALSVTYAKVARAGLAAPLTIDLHREGGFTGPITISATADYLDIFDAQGMDPEPAAQTADGERLYWAFNPPPEGEDFSLDLDVSVKPSSQLGSSGQITVLDGGHQTAAVDVSTWLVP
jgi:hypothetical protein